MQALGRNNRYGALELAASSAEEGAPFLGDESAPATIDRTQSPMSTGTMLKAASAFLLGTAAIAAFSSPSTGLIGGSAAFDSLSSKRSAQAFYKDAMSNIPKTRMYETSSDDASSYFIYKHAIPISNGTASTISTTLNTYLVPVSGTVDLGCTTGKVVASTAAPTLSLPDGTSSTLSGEIHFVDSTTFKVSGSSVTAWVSAIEDMGMSTFNAFMYNKVQLYVPDLSPALAKMHTDGIDMMLRLSSSEDVDDVAHVGIQIAGRIYELVGPTSSIIAGDYSSTTAELISLFSTWSDAECPEAHELTQFNLTQLATYYEAAYKTSDSQDWETDTGLYTPMIVSISGAASSIDSVASVLSALTTVASAETSTSTYYDGACEVATITFDTSSMYQPFARYVSNAAASQGSDSFTISEWEDEVAASHVEYTLDTTDDDGNSMSGWDHYLDQHIGLSRYFYTASSTACYAENVEVLSQVQGLPVGARSDTGDSAAAANATHYYTGYPGLITWEYNVYNCPASATTTYDELCGCSADNSAEAYYVETNGEAYCTFTRR